MLAFFHHPPSDTLLPQAPVYRLQNESSSIKETLSSVAFYAGEEYARHIAKMANYVTPRFMDSSVSQADIANHLRVYGLVRSHLFTLAQRKQVYYDKDDILWPTADGRLYLRRSVYRFRLWIEKVLRPKYEQDGASHGGLEDKELPPYDVLLVLHAFMLHPRAFYGDTVRLFPELGVLVGFPLAQVGSLIDDCSTYVPSPAQTAFWEASTGEAFDVPQSTSAEDEFEVTCPGCHTAFRANWLSSSEDGKGSALAARCVSCGMEVTDLLLGASIFAKDITRAKSGEGVGLAGTLLTDNGVLDPARSRNVTIDIAKKINLYDIEHLSADEVAQALLQVPEEIFRDISVDFLSYYGLPGGFSFDLGAAVLRQTGFASKMYHNGWTDPHFPSERSEILEESISRYAGFLQLSMDKSAGSLGPAHDIDLVWHTHQLKNNYRMDFLRIFNWFLDHVDFAPIGVLATSYSNGGDKWEEIFGTPYHEYFLDARYTSASVAVEA